MGFIWGIHPEAPPQYAHALNLRPTEWTVLAPNQLPVKSFGWWSLLSIIQEIIVNSRAFSVVGPSTWNGLPPELRIFNRTTSPAFFSYLKTALFDRAGVGSASE